MKAALCAVLALLMSTCARAQDRDKRLMTDAQYKEFLAQVEENLPKWEKAFSEVDPSKTPNISYASGQDIVQNRDLGIVEVHNVRFAINRLKKKRTVTDELILSGFMRNLMEQMASTENGAKNAGVRLTYFEAFYPSLGNFNILIANGLLDRVEMLEENECKTR